MGIPQQAISKVREDGIVSAITTGIQKPRVVLRSSGIYSSILQKYTIRKGVLTVREVKIDTQNEIVHPQIPRIYADSYENEIMDIIREYRLAENSVVELGGGIGVVAAYVDNRLSDDLEHIVVEPNPSILPTLKRTRELNECDFEVVEKAYQSENEPITLTTDGDFTQASTFRNQTDSTDVSGINLCTLINSYSLDEFVLIIDIEGAEVDLINTELDVILENCPYIIIEYHRFEDIRQEVNRTKEKIEDTELELVDCFHENKKLEKAVYRNPRLSNDTE